MQQQKTSKAQSGKQPKDGRFASSIMSYGSTVTSCRTAGQIAVNRRFLLGSCCCAGPVRDAHGRRYTLFPYWVRGNTKTTVEVTAPVAGLVLCGKEYNEANKNYNQ